MRNLKDEEVNGKTYASLEDAGESTGAFRATAITAAGATPPSDINHR